MKIGDIQGAKNLLEKLDETSLDPLAEPVRQLAVASLRNEEGEPRQAIEILDSVR